MVRARMTEDDDAVAIFLFLGSGNGFAIVIAVSRCNYYGIGFCVGAVCVTLYEYFFCALLLS